MVSTKYFFNIDKNDNGFFSTNSAYQKASRKYHVTLKTGVIATDISAFSSQNWITIIKYIKTDNSYLNSNNISQNYYFYFFLVSIRDFKNI